MIACSPKSQKNEGTDSSSSKIDATASGADAKVEMNQQKQVNDSWAAIEVQKLDVKGHHTQFVNDDGGLLYSTENYQGLWYYDFASKQREIITEKAGSGYQPQWVDGKIIYQVKERMRTLESYDFERKTVSKIDQSQSSQSPIQFTQALKGNPTLHLSKDLLGIELINDQGEKSYLQPQREGNYVSATLSPNKKMMLYEVAGLGGFVADLSGKTIVKLGEVDMPKWIDDELVVFVQSEDDGMQTLDSKVFVLDIESGEKQEIIVDDVELLAPAVSKDKQQLSVHTPQGDIFIINKK